MWFDKIAKGLSGPQVINDSKTPSGRVHVGSLRGVLIHDAIYRTLRAHDIEAVYLYGVDDYDPLDGLPVDASPELKEKMGLPLCQVPAPAGSKATDLADHYIAEFLGIFKELGVSPQIYRMRDVYRSGRFNAAIDEILQKADRVREVYAEVSGAERPANWHPFQAICENCGRIGTTEVTAYDGKEVTYHCRKELVSWAQGCGYQGKVSPFDGNGKLPWKLEWVAKWQTLGITIEGAGKDHCTRGGSRDVAGRCLQAIFEKRAPLNVPYEFFLVSGAKMSSSKGIGTAARDMADFLPPEMLRFLMIKTPPKKTVNFSTDFNYVSRMFNEYDKLAVSANSPGGPIGPQADLWPLLTVTAGETASHPVGFQLLSALLQLPHLDVDAEIEKRTPAGVSVAEKMALTKRIRSARYWLQHYAIEADRFSLQEILPESARELSVAQQGFLARLGRELPLEVRDEEGYQKYLFDTARLTPIKQKEAFSAFYCVLFDKAQGPKGGALLSYLDRDFLQQRCQEVAPETAAFWQETGVTVAEGEAWLAEMGEACHTVELTPCLCQGESGWLGVVELLLTLADGKQHLLRVSLAARVGTALGDEAAALATMATRLSSLSDQLEKMCHQVSNTVSIHSMPLQRL